jgi:hypothetical protein
MKGNLDEYLFVNPKLSFNILAFDEIFDKLKEVRRRTG